MNAVATSLQDKVCISGILPSVCMESDLLPARTEGGTGGIISWAGKLWVVTYVSHKKGTGAGTGLYVIDEELNMRKHPESRVGTYANRYIHCKTNQLFIGPHVVDAEGAVRTIEELIDLRLTATMAHLEDPDNMVYSLGMEGELFEVDVNTLKATQIADLTKELKLPEGCAPHFKGSYTGQGRLIVTNNTYDEPEFLGQRNAGRLAEWDGKEWRILSEWPFNEVYGRGNFGNVMYATGWDPASAIMKVLIKGEWSTYRLPKSSQNFDHYCQTEWPRIREVEHERLLMNCHGIFYELAPHAYGGEVFGVQPVCTHLRVIPDFCSYRGLLVLGGDQNTPGGSANPLTGNSQANLWFGNIDDLWSWGKPRGWGGVWREASVKAGESSDPYLMFGFDKKTLHLSHDADREVEFTVEVDYLGTRQWKQYEKIRVSAGGYEFHVFPDGYSAHWVRVTSSDNCTATAQFMYS